MGAAGYVTIYEREAVERAYAGLYPDEDITADWWYLDTITAELNGVRYILDYSDDQGMHEGTGNSFWFNHEEGEGWDNTRAQRRCIAALYAARELTSVEVWT